MRAALAAQEIQGCAGLRRQLFQSKPELPCIPKQCPVTGVYELSAAFDAMSMKLVRLAAPAGA
jgi:hypothetical protein